MKSVKCIAPGSCGEFIQGIYEGSPCLVSCPVDVYSRVEIREKRPRALLDPKATMLLAAVFEAYGIPRDEKHRIEVQIVSDIPREKGMASSTADLTAIAGALSAYYNLEMDEKAIARFCAQVEASDNIMFQKLNLFNQLEGSVYKSYHCSYAGEILIIHFTGSVNTAAYHRLSAMEKNRNVSDFYEVLAHFENGLVENKPQLLGKACTQSARLNQQILYKPYLEAVVNLTEDCGGYGVVAAHSGTVLGVLHSAGDFDYEGFVRRFESIIPGKDYEKLEQRKVISGGVSFDTND